MKNLLLLIMIVGVGIFAQSCIVEETGIPGPPGPRGADGLDGLDGRDGADGEEAYVFEYEIDFVAPDYSNLLFLPDDFTMLDSDVALVYLLWGVEEDGTEIWRQLPQTLITADGLLQYNFDFTKFDVSVFLDADFPLSILGADFTDDWIARVVVVPGQFTGRAEPVDYSDYNEVKERFNLKDTKFDTSNYKTRPN